ncbi:hypothetical protein G7047_05405 [Diaphorobacter sp. HDW4A]|uniref:hypothetical protein n=1 Tax=Diaphorobacter sp. HDW4A TaxID=2714924 RepID=UPI00140D9900|nr:hypothetical protein [Diaphorobacter sp. HDW4A]QIL79405.1 hypothetical protein G7047_05405 [Diaphorobacter sp. HDW4A]
MTKIFLYGAEATYAGHCDFEWHAPALGDRHKVILFLAQDEETSQEDKATSELTRFGFVDLQIKAGRPIQVESLNDLRMNSFRTHYAGALAEGCSLVWYP